MGSTNGKKYSPWRINDTAILVHHGSGKEISRYSQISIFPDKVNFGNKIRFSLLDNIYLLRHYSYILEVYSYGS